MEWVKSLIFTLSSSSFRPFRHTATIAALALTTALTELAENLVKEQTRLANQSEKLRTKSSAGDLRKSNDLKTQQESLLAKKQTIDNQIMDFVNGYILTRF